MAIFKAISKSSKSIGGTKGVLEYIGKKADETLGINCSNDYKKAFSQFQETKEFYQKLEGRQYKHFILSLDKDKGTKEIALKIATEASKRLFKNHEVFLAVHTDTDNIHCHIVINSVDLETGKKFQQSSNDLENYKKTINDIGKEYNISITNKSQELQYGEIRTTNKNKLKIIEKNFLGQGTSDILTVYKTLDNILKNNNIKNPEELGKKLKENKISLFWKETNKNVTLELDPNVAVSKKNKFRLTNLAKTFSDPRMEKIFLEHTFSKNLEMEKGLKLTKQKTKEMEGIEL